MLLFKYEADFRPNNSTLTALTQMCDNRFEKIDRDELNGIVFFEIRKVFDSIIHKILRNKLDRNTVWYL